ncbi:MAG: 3-keto-5-aminohexanoate cleavage protein [Anaerolineales bacterium]|nr:3-keto-5-aminohexanoate cleavage protein [Anaerolineales bacterium]
MIESMTGTTWNYANTHEWMKRVRKGFPPVIVCCAITGGAHGKEASEYLPETAEEQADQAYEAYKAGASMVHIHARDPKCIWKSSSDPEVYRKVNAMIRERCPDIIINNTTGGSADMTDEERMAAIYANPEVCSLDVCAAAFTAHMRERPAPLMHPHPAMTFDALMGMTNGVAEKYAREMQARGIKPEIELMTPYTNQALVLIERGCIDPPYMFQFVLGADFSSPTSLADLQLLAGALPQPAIFATCGIGKFQMPMTVMSLLLGGNVRVGLEDNIYHSRGRKYKSNAETVERIVHIANELGREIATPQQARQMLGLSAVPSSY